MRCSLLLSLLALAACSRSNNLFMGRVEAAVGEHPVVVTDCYRTNVAPPEKTQEDGQTVYRFAPCKDAAIMIRNEELTVNGQAYGHLNPNDGVLVDHSVVSIERAGK